MEKFEGVEYFEAQVVDGVIVLMPVEVKPMNKIRLEKIRQKASRSGLTARDVESAVAWSRSRRVPVSGAAVRRIDP
ncbi:MAG: AbrB/MazE/SpoVT family DNA-binding domain-containing protein [Candidatus Moduliflexus flocculans]|nr:AbrB/MazE/SpoVT family DNA-binding domain-containing protein [Candidatus Moduliflexus flocculans]